MLRQDFEVVTLQSAATANGNGTPADVSGLNGAQFLEVRETAGGTCTLALAGSFDGTNFYPIGYQQVDNVASPARAVANLSVTANLAHVYQLLDPYTTVRAVISAVAGGCNLTVKLYAVAV